MRKKFDLRPADALDLMERYTANRDEAKVLLANALRDGDLKARAKIWETRRSNFHAAADRSAAPRDAKRQIIRKGSLKRSRNFAMQSRDWNWDRGFFFCEIQSRPFRAEIYQSVKFSRESFNSVVRREAQRKQAKGGRNPNLEAWEQVCFAVVRLVKNGSIDLTRPMTTKTFADTIANEFGGSRIKPSDRRSLTAEQIEARFRSVCPLADDTLEQFAERFRAAVWSDLADQIVSSAG